MTGRTLEFRLGEQLADGRVTVGVSDDRTGALIRIGDFAIMMDLDEFEEFVSACNRVRSKLSLSPGA
jgi:hypothetical protein